MKKLLSTALAVASVAAVFAQTPLKNEYPKFPGIEPEKKNFVTPQNKVGQVSTWFDFTAYLSNNAPPGADLQTYAAFLFPDSNVVFISNDANNQPSTFYWYLHSVSHVFDVKDDAWGIAGFQNFTRKDNFTIDSLFVEYIYVRNLPDPNIVDTLYIDFFDASRLTRGQFGTAPDTQVYAKPGFDYASGRGQGPVFTITKLLTGNDSTALGSGGWSFKSLVEPVGLNINGSSNPNINANIWGYSLTFKPGYSYNEGDTMEIAPSVAGITAGKKLNYFGFRQLQNEGDAANQLRTQGFYNNYGQVVKQTRYAGTNANGWTGYIPGNAYFEGQYMVTAFYVTGLSTVSKDQVNTFGAALGNVYPNPSTSGANLNFEFGLQNSGDVTLEIYDIMGRKVATVVNNEVMEAGEHTISFSNNLKAGVYVYTLKAGNYVTSKKFTVAQ